MSTSIGVSFKGLTREQARARFETFLDEYLEQQVRLIAADMSAEDGHECDSARFLSEVAQVRHMFERHRAPARAQFAAVLDAMFGPERG